MPGHAQLRRLRAAETARSKREQANRNTFGWLKLPVELRNIIFDLVLPHDRLIDPFYANCDRYRRDGHEVLWFTELHTDLAHWSTQLGFSQTTRLIRAEAVKYYYGSNLFVLGIDGPQSDELTKSWIRTRPKEAFSVLQTVLLGGWHRCLTNDAMLHMRVVELDLFTLETYLLEVKIENDFVKRVKVCEPCKKSWDKELASQRKRRLFRRLLETWEEGEPDSERTIQVIKTLQCYSRSFAAGKEEAKSCGEYYMGV